MDSQALIEKLLTLPDTAAQKELLEAYPTLLDDQVADALKKQADHFLRADIQHSLDTAGLLLHLAELTENPLHRALGLLAEANTRSIGLGEYQRAIDFYNEATRIYQAQDQPVEQARAQIGKLYALANLGRYAEALETGRWAGRVLEDHAQWHPLATLTSNLAIVHGRMGEDTEALALFDQVRELYSRLGPAGGALLPRVEQNRAILLRNLGRFDASIQASQRAWETLTRLGQTAEAARAQQNLAITYFTLGRYNEALELLDRVRDIFLADGRRRDAILVELFISDCLLALRRFADVLDKCRQVRVLFTELGTRFEVAQAVLNEAIAYAGLHRYDESMASLAEARRLFSEEGNRVWVTSTDLKMAAVFHHRGRFEESLALAQACAGVFRCYGLLTKEAQANLISARAAAALSRHDLALRLVEEALTIGESQDIPSLTYQCYHLLGTLNRVRGDLQEAVAKYDRAIRELERLRGRLMVEFRAEFLEDKQIIYEDMVDLYLDLDQPLQALNYAERAKSRVLLDLLAYRLDLSIQARELSDRPLVQELVRLRAERDRLYRRWEGREEAREEGWTTSDESRQQTRESVLALEKQITELWHRLLIRNADYARDASMWYVRTEPVQPYLAPGTLLLEYFVAHQEIVVFLVTAETVQVRRLPGHLAKVQPLVRLLWLNLKAASRSIPDRVSNSISNALGVLQQLHELLIAPLNDALTQYPQLIIVPHGPLHYLPFHALHDGNVFLLERHEISYLPGASLLRYLQRPEGSHRSPTKGEQRRTNDHHRRTWAAASPEEDGRDGRHPAVVVGHSLAGRLPYAVQEAQSIATLLGSQPLLEDEATVTRLLEAVPHCRALHLATHGNFRSDNPLFSGLVLADTSLTTLEVFNLRLEASLVTLSACQTGQNVVAGGDELLGLMRGFLYAGAASLVLSLWTVEDRSTAHLMGTFYQKLMEGGTKSAALRYAQLQLMRERDDTVADMYTHPYFWAPFFLVGDTGPL